MDNNKDYLNIYSLIGRMVARRKLYIVSSLCVAVISSLLIVGAPKYYTCTVKIVPEESSNISMGSLGALASSFGVDLSAATSVDAISPIIYPDLLSSPLFISTLFPIQIKTEEGVETNYYDYICHYQKIAWWNVALGKIKRMMPKFGKKKNFGMGGAADDYSGHLDLFQLNEDQTARIRKTGKNIDCFLDKKTGVITISFEDNDPLVCALMTDSISAKLQEFVIDYRTHKTRVDMEYYSKLKDEALESYYESRDKYARFVDANKGNSFSASINVRRQDLENEMSTKYNTYTAFNAQYQASLAKVQEKSPVFTSIENATVPVLATGPRRTLFVLAMIILNCIAVTFFVFWPNIRNQLTHLK